MTSGRSYGERRGKIVKATIQNISFILIKIYQNRGRNLDAFIHSKLRVERPYFYIKIKVVNFIKPTRAKNVVDYW